MSFRTKIWAAMAVAGIVPLVLLGALSYSTGRRALAETVGHLQAQGAREVARQCQRLVSDTVANLKLSVSYIPFEDLHGAEVGHALAIPYRQLPYVNALALLDDKGQSLTEPVREEHPENFPELAGHEPVGAAELELLSKHIPLAAALASGAAVGPPYRAQRGPRVAVAVRVPRHDWVLAAELSLAELQSRMEDLARSGSVAYLVDATGAVLAHGNPAVASLSDGERALVTTGLKSGAGQVDVVRRADGEWLTAFEPVPQLGWGIVVAEKGSLAFRATDRVRLLTLLWASLALLLTLALGAVLARSLTRPMKTLSAVAKAVTGGILEPAQGVEGDDELGSFAKAFNHMISEIKRRDLEIRGWNEELQQRVDQRTSELKEAQDQILRTRRLAALGSLGAGVAHEINNPLTSIMGLLAILQRDLPEASPASAQVALALDQAKRVSKIVNDLRQLATREQAAAGRPFALETAVSAALDGCAEQLKAGRIVVHTAFVSTPSVLGDALQIQQLVTHLVQNAIGAMPEGGTLAVGLKAVAEAVKLTVADTGKGIAPELRERIFDPFFSTKDQPARLGMGLSVCHAIAEAHHGKISVESTPGEGTIFTLLLPAAPAQAHIY